LQKRKGNHIARSSPSATDSITRQRMSRVISALIETHPELADVFRCVLHAYLLPNAAVAKARYDSVVSELQAIIVEHREQQNEMNDWDDRWQAEGGDAGEDEDNDGVWGEVYDEEYDEEQDTPAVEALCPSWIQLCYGAGILQLVE
jgi:hypothetical protein